MEHEKMKPYEPADTSYWSVPEKRELMEYFQLRDCYFKSYLEKDPGFKVLHKKALWRACSPDDAENAYGDLEKTDLFLKVLQAQMACGKGLPDKDSVVVDDVGIEGASSRQIGLIAVLVLVTVLIQVCLAYCIIRYRRAQKIRKYQEEPTEGVFVNDPSKSKEAHLYDNGDEIIHFESEEGRSQTMPKITPGTIQSITPFDGVVKSVHPSSGDLQPKGTTSSTTVPLGDIVAIPPAEAFNDKNYISQRDSSGEEPEEDGLGDGPKGSFQSVEMEDQDDHGDSKDKSKVQKDGLIMI
jgi:hypothetical protein